VLADQIKRGCGKMDWEQIGASGDPSAVRSAVIVSLRRAYPL
jgi:hypothetical protein